MGSAYFIATEREISGYDAAEIEGKMLSMADMQLEKSGFYAKSGVKGLHHFCGDDISDLFDEEDLEGIETGETWFDASEGLATVEALLNYLKSTPDVVRHQGIVIDDLQTFQSALKRCEEEGVKWYLSIDI